METAVNLRKTGWLTLLFGLVGCVDACTKHRDFGSVTGDADASVDSGAGHSAGVGGAGAGGAGSGGAGEASTIGKTGPGGRAGGGLGDPGGGATGLGSSGHSVASGGGLSTPEGYIDADIGHDAAGTSVDGAACTADAECAHGSCVDGVCCATACTGCYACSNTLTGKDDGTCAPVVSGKDPHNFCPDETSTNQCGNDGTCDGKGACRKVGTSHECTPASCSADGKSYLPAVTCDGKGACPAVEAQDCGGARCTVDNGCLTSCTSSSQCKTGFYCDAGSGTCTAQRKNGKAATNAAQCTSGVIADGVCCDKACTGCSACTVALNFQSGSATDGQCLPVMPGKPAPHSACAASSAAPCGADGTCNGADACHYPTVGTPCGDPSCAGSTLTTRACDSSQQCAVKTTSCGASLACNQAGTACLGTCTKDGDCASGYCVGGTCSSTRRVGDACSASVECPNGYCVDGYCCNAKCDGDCQSCSQTRGQCTTVTTARTACTGSGTCGKKYCDGTHTSCVYPGSQTACPNQCSSDWSAVMSSTCDGAGNCGAGSANNCSSSQYCSTSSNQCTAKISNTTTSCSKDIQCSTGKCCSTCVNVSTDNNNCGSCGNQCGANRTCKSGSCACSGHTFSATCGNTCGSWNFESGPSSTENWTKMVSPDLSTSGNGALNLAISSTRPSGYSGSGSYSLVVPMVVDTINSWVASVGVQICQTGRTTSLGGFTISGYVYLAGPTFIDYAGLAVDAWGGSKAITTYLYLQTPSSVMPVNQWVRFEKYLEFPDQYDRFAIRLGPNGQWNGTMYLDEITLTGL